MLKQLRHVYKLRPTCSLVKLAQGTLETGQKIGQLLSASIKSGMKDESIVIGVILLTTISKFGLKIKFGPLCEKPLTASS